MVRKDGSIFHQWLCNNTKVQYKMKEKQLYEAPWAQTFVVQAEGMICQSDLFNEADPGIAGLELTLEDDFIYNL